MPRLIEEHSRDVVTAKGRPATLNCRVRAIGNKTVKRAAITDKTENSKSFKILKFSTIFHIVVFIQGFSYKQSKIRSHRRFPGYGTEILIFLRSEGVS